MEEPKIPESGGGGLIILPDQFQSRLKPNASLIISEAKKGGVISTREITAILPNSTLSDPPIFSETLSSLANYLSEIGISIAKGKTDLERRKISLPTLIIASASVSGRYRSPSEDDIKLIKSIAENTGGDDQDVDFPLYQKIFQKFPVLDHEQTVELAKQNEAGHPEAFYLLVLHNLRLVLKWAKHYLGRGLELQDMMQEGIMGLMKGIHKYDWRRGFHLTTYTSWWIKQMISRAIENNCRGIRIPVHIFEKYLKIMKVSKELRWELNREPTTEEIALKMSVPIRLVQKILRYVDATESSSLDAPLDGHGEDGEHGNMYGALSDTTTLSPSDALEAKEVLEETTVELRAFLISLNTIPAFDDRFRTIFRMRYGLDSMFIRRATLEEVGLKFGVTRERIRKIVEVGWERLRMAGILKNEKWLLHTLEKIQELESIAGTFTRI